MCCSARAWPPAGLCIALSAACAGSEGPVELPTVAAILPACGDTAARTPVTVLGYLPVTPVISVSGSGGSQLDTNYRAWVGDVELSNVGWADASELTGVVPAGIPAGTYALTVQSPLGARGAKDDAFEVRQGACPVETAAIALTGPIAAPATATLGQLVTVTATVQNSGQAAALGVQATVVSAPAALTFLGGPGGPQDVPAGQARTFTWTYTASTAGAGVLVIDAAGSAADTGLPVAAQRVSTNLVVVLANAFTVGGKVTGLKGSGLVLHNGGDSLTLLAGATSYVFPTPVPSGERYAVTVTTQPTDPSQSCTVAHGSGTIDAADVTDVDVTCSKPKVGLRFPRGGPRLAWQEGARRGPVEPPTIQMGYRFDGR